MQEKRSNGQPMRTGRQLQESIAGRHGDIPLRRPPHRKDIAMIWKVISLGLILWFIQTAFHLTGTMTLLLSIPLVLGLVANFILSSRGLAAVSRKM
jgi:hypothetical protein